MLVALVLIGLLIPNLGDGTLVRKQVTVDGTAAFTDTGIDLEKGQRVSVQASGTVFHNTAESSGPDGIPNRPELLTPLPTENHNALIGRLAGSELFRVGATLEATAPAGGRLELGINDGGLDNNRGTYQAEVVVRSAK